MDGWNEDVVETMSSILNKFNELKYEIDNCIRGSYTNCTNPQSLSGYLLELAEELKEVAEDINYCCDQDEDDDEEEED